MLKVYCDKCGKELDMPPNKIKVKELVAYHFEDGHLYLCDDCLTDLIIWLKQLPPMIQDPPKSCYDCPLEDAYDGYNCRINQKPYNWGLKERPQDCPLIEVPEPHGRLVDADALLKTCGMAIDCYDCPNGNHGWCMRSQDAANICEAIEDAPTVIPASGEADE